MSLGAAASNRTEKDEPMKTIKNANHPVAIAVAPLKEAAMMLAEKYAREDIAAGVKILEAAGWDIDAVAPQPESLKDSREAYRSKAARRSFFFSFTSTINASSRSYHSTEPRIVRLDPELVERVVRLAKEDAAASFIGYVNKLVSKIGPAASAMLTAMHGSNLWAHSALDVALADGAKERWETKQIWNRSCLGKSFPQWPTRQVDGAKRTVVRKAPTVHFRSDEEHARKNYTLGYACAGSAMGAHRIHTSATGSTSDVSKVTCTRCLKQLATRARSAS